MKQSGESSLYNQFVKETGLQYVHLMQDGTKEQHNAMVDEKYIEWLEKKLEEK